MQRLSSLFSILILATVIWSCKKGTPTITADKVPATIAAYTSGTISRETVIKVQFTEAVVKPEQVGAIFDDSPFASEPKFDGIAAWSDRQTIELRPQEPLTPGEKYKITLALNEFMAVPKGEETLEFSFSVMQQSFTVRLDGLAAKEVGEGSKQVFNGVVITNDVANAANVEKVISAKLDGKKLGLSWKHSSDRHTHEFTVADILRVDADRVLAISWDGEAIGVKKQGEEKISVPGLKNFTVTKVRAQQELEQHIEVHFSDSLLRKQNLRGLVHINKGKPRLVIDGSILRIYGSKRFGSAVQLTIERGVKNFRGYKLTHEFSEKVHFAPLKPAVRFGSKGVLVPTTAGLTIPIETANLKAVLVEAIRVPDQNVPQFLQVNDFNTANEMRRVGRVVWKQVVDLGTGADNKNRWSRFGLDLAPLITGNTSGLYRLNLSFRRQHILYDCATPALSEPENIEKNFDDIFETSNEQSYWDSAENYYANEDRGRPDDPCSKAFYLGYNHNEITASRNVLITNIGLIAKVGSDNSILITATDLRTTQPIIGATIEVLDFQQQVITAGTTDGDGVVRLKVDHRPFVVVARNGEQRSFLKLDDGSALSLAHFDISGMTVSRGIKGKIYGERGVWRPGDDIYLTFVLFDPDKHIPEEHPLRFELIDPQGRLVDSQVTHESVNGFYAFHTKTEHDALTGNYIARVIVGGTVFTETLKVEMVRPNRLKIELDFDTKMLYANDKISGTLKSTWLHGAIARNLKTDVQVSLYKRATKFPIYSEYIFEDPAQRFNPESIQLFEGNLNEQGEAQITGQFAVRGKAPGMLTASFSTRVFENSGVYSSDTFAVPYSPYKLYIGIKAPKGDASRGMLLTDKKHELSIVAVDADGKLANEDVSVECKLYKVQWRWWWDKSEDTSLADYVESRNHTAVASGKVNLKNGKGAWHFEVKYPEWGRYILLVRDIKGGHRSGKIVYIDWPGWAGRAQKDNPGGASVLAFSADKQEYNVGDKVQINIPAAQSGRALVTIESGSKVVKADWLEAKGENTRYSFTASAEMAPNIYVNVELLQPHEQSQNDLPIRMYGVIPIKIIDPDTRLQPEIVAPEVFEPESKAKIVVKEAKGMPMTYTVAVVDEGLLGLTRYQVPNLWDHFYRREALGVHTWDVFEYVAGAYGAALERMLAIGGDEEGDDSQGGRKADRFPPMVRFIGPFALGRGDKATHTIDIPRYVGSVRVMVVAGQGRAFGSAEKSVFVRKPLLLLATLPRVIGPEEEVDLPVTIFALEEKIKQAKVQVKVSGPVVVDGKASRTINFKSVGDRTITFGLVAKEQSGIAKIDVFAEGAGEKARQTIEIDVRIPGVAVSDVIAGVAQPGKTFHGSMNLPGFAGTNTAMLEVSRIPPIDLGRRLAFLIQYPHGCVEQTTSSVFPQLYLSELLDLSNERKNEIENNIRAGIDRLRLFQTPSGGFSYWPGGVEPDDWSSNYAGHFLIEAKKAGYLVQDEVIEHWKKYQHVRAAQRINSNGRDVDVREQAYRLYSLALADSPDLGAMNRLKENAKLPAAAMWQLTAAYQLAGKAEIARKLAKEADMSIPEYRELAGTYGSTLRDQAIILETLWLLKDNEQSYKVVKSISDQLSTSEWLSTQEISYALIAIARFAGATRGEDSIRASYTFANKTKKIATNAVIAQEPLNIGKATEAKASLTNNSEKPLFIRLIGTGIPKYGSETDAERGLRLNVVYKNTADSRINPVEIEQGTDFISQITVRNASGRTLLQNLALSYPVAAGWEIRNQRIEGGFAAKTSIFDYQDVRDDRVFIYFNLKPGESKTFQVMLNASYTGHFYLPLVAVEAMYDGSINARAKGQWVHVKKAGVSMALE
ncbi:MAG: hypothetical protein JW841_12965 [Deltaproteobacteria bacterium]|nr:hypothetical protein [Deltaproteobacteria bacterium]